MDMMKKKSEVVASLCLSIKSAYVVSSRWGWMDLRKAQLMLLFFFLKF